MFCLHVRLQWPTYLAIDPLDDTLHILDKRGGIWREWPEKRGGLWREWPYKKGTTVLLESYKIYRLLCFVYRLGYNGRQTWQ